MNEPFFREGAKEPIRKDESLGEQKLKTESASSQTRSLEAWFDADASKDGERGDYREGEETVESASNFGGLAMGKRAKARPSSDDRNSNMTIREFAQRLQETGILPLKIRLPKSGTVYRFNRLMTTQDALKLDATFVHLPTPWVPFAAFGLLLVPVGGVAVTRFRRA